MSVDVRASTVESAALLPTTSEDASSVPNLLGCTRQGNISWIFFQPPWQLFRVRREYDYLKCVFVRLISQLFGRAVSEQLAGSS
jgi:hypothetical protein